MHELGKQVFFSTIFQVQPLTYGRKLTMEKNHRGLFFLGHLLLDHPLRKHWFQKARQVLIQEYKINLN